MEKSSVLELKRILIAFREKHPQLAFAKLCCEILFLWVSFDVEGFDNDAFATEMLARFKQGKHPFNVK